LSIALGGGADVCFNQKLFLPLIMRNKDKKLIKNTMPTIPNSNGTKTGNTLDMDRQKGQ
jgi:hypothetical protein